MNQQLRELSKDHSCGTNSGFVVADSLQLREKRCNKNGFSRFRPVLESLWEKPEGFQGEDSKASHLGHNEGSSASAWQEAVSPEGYTYYYNTETGADLPPPEEPSAPGTEPTVERAQASTPAEGAGEAKPQSNPNIYFMKRKAEPLEKEVEGDGGRGAEEKEEEEKATVSAPVPEEAQKEKAEAVLKQQQEEEEEEKKRKEEEKPLPQVKEAVETEEADLVLGPEPKHKFSERTITSLGDQAGQGGPAAFRKSKTQNGKARSLRQRRKDD
ncbi:hypothetical protein CRUP_014934 [Coryphaenoides rupestris]|nr:hypothetical protein CRUP_014934 [Coryphaenoides rupestris]